MTTNPREDSAHAAELKNKIKLGSLPHFASLAFLARSGQRLLPAFDISSQAALPANLERSKEIVRLTSKIAAGTRSDHKALLALAGDPNSIDSNTQSDSAIGFATESFNRACRSTAMFADAVIAYFAGASMGDESARITAESSIDYWRPIAVRHFAATAGNLMSPASSPKSVQSAIAGAMLADFELLKHAAAKEGWTDETPVPPEFFGPLWPDGEPAEWPEEGKEAKAGPSELVLELDVPDDMTDDEVVQVVRELSLAMDSLHRAYGGSGLKIKRLEIDQNASVPTGVSR